MSEHHPTHFGKVGVLMGGRSAERDVSLMSGQGVLTALHEKGVDAHAFDTGKRDLAALAQEKFDRVFIALHGRYGEDGTIQGALEQLGIPYTGSGVLASALAMDKIATKNIWQGQGLPTPRFALIDAKSDWARVIADIGLPLIVKPVHEGSTIGLSKVVDRTELQAAYIKAAQLGGPVMAEEFIDGMELTCALLGQTSADTVALPVIHVVAPEGNYDYKNKYFSDETRYICPADIDADLEQRTRALSLAAFHAVGCRGWARADLMQCKRDGVVYLLEINTSPGMTGHSLVPMAAKAVGIDYANLVLRILAGAQLELRANQYWKPDLL